MYAYLITYLSKVNVPCRLLLGICCTPIFRQRHVKDLGRLAKRAAGRLQINMLAIEPTKSGRADYAVQE